MRTYLIGAGLTLVLAGLARGQGLPPTGPVQTYAGVAIFGQCVPNARNVEARLTGRTLPFLGNNGVAADLWVVPTPGFAKIANRPGAVPPRNAVLIWSRQLGNTGHAAIAIGIVRPGVVRIVDTNWNLDGRGQIHDVSLGDGRILGWLVAQ